MWMMLIGDPFEVVGVFFSIGLSAIALYAGWIGVRWAHRKLEPARFPEGRDLDQVHERLARLEECEIRLAEVEERLDFTERMLAQAKPDAAMLPGPGGERR